MRVTNRQVWAGYIPLLCLPLGAGAGGWAAHALGAYEAPFALLGAAGGFLVSGALLRRVYAEPDNTAPKQVER